MGNYLFSSESKNLHQKPTKYLSIDHYTDAYNIFVKLDKCQQDGRLTSNCIFYPPIKFENYFKIKFLNDEEIKIISSKNTSLYAELSTSYTITNLPVFNLDHLVSEINYLSLDV